MRSAVDPPVEEEKPGVSSSRAASSTTGKCIRREPTGRVECRQSRGGEAAALRRVEKCQRVCRNCARRVGGVAENDLSVAAFAERDDVLSKGRESFPVLFNDAAAAPPGSLMTLR